jgi:hypothetical protein
MKNFAFLLLMAFTFQYTTALASSSVTLSGTVPSDCTVSTPTAPAATAVGATLRNPGSGATATPVAISFTATCGTFNPQVAVKATNGYFKGATAGSPQIQYTASVSGTNFTSATAAAGTTLATAPGNMGTLSSSAASPLSLNIQTAQVANLPADTYSETFTITVNGQ